MEKRSRFATWAAAMAAAGAVMAGAVQSAKAAAFTAGDIAVYRVGDGSAALASSATAVYVDEYNPTTGALVQSVPLPTVASNGNNPLVASGTATSEGMMTLSADGNYLVLTGYSASLGTTKIASTAAATTPRVVGLIDGNGNINTSTALTNIADGNNIRSATSPDGSTIYVADAKTGLSATTVGSTTATQLSTTVTNLRTVSIAGGNLYVSTSSGSTVRVGQVGTGLPATGGQTITNLPGLSATAGSPYQFFLADLSPTVPGVDTLYVADDTPGTITKYSLEGGTTWVSNGSITATGVRGLTGTVNGSTVTLFGTTDGALYDVTDTSGFDAAPSSSTASTLATAGTNEAFRGIALAPSATPEPAGLSVVALAGGALIARRRRKQS